MTKKRILSITSQDKFLLLPDTARCLYYELAMNTDSKGFAPNSMFIRSRYSEEDVRILNKKGYIKITPERLIHVNIDIK